MQQTPPALRQTDLSGLGTRTQGKVRDVYAQDGRLILISTDRHSSFDRIIAHVPGKGAILNRTAAHWFEATSDIVPNHVLAVPDPNATVARRCRPLPIEAVMRGYLTGVTSTSIWTHYAQGRRDFGDFTLPDGLRKNQKLPSPVFTPSTKEETHDRALSKSEIVAEGLLTADLLDRVEDVSRRLFSRGEELAAQAGLILVDTKYEFGIAPDGALTLIDEIHTQDSSRWWNAASYPGKFDAAEEPDNFDKEMIRRWLAERCDPYKDAVLPEIPAALIAETASRYAEIHRRLTGRGPDPAPVSEEALLERLAGNLAPYAV